MAAKFAVWGGLHEFGDVSWLPRQRKAIYREDDRVDVSTPGNGLNNYIGFRAQPTLGLLTARAAEKRLEENGTDIARYLAARLPAATFELQAYGFTNDDVFFTGYPVVGFQHRIQASGTCINGGDDALLSTCTPASGAPSSTSLASASPCPRSRRSSPTCSGCATSTAQPARLLRDFCGMDAKMGVLMRYVKASSAYLGKAEDSPDFDFTYYRSYDERARRGLTPTSTTSSSRWRCESTKACRRAALGQEPQLRL